MGGSAGVVRVGSWLGFAPARGLRRDGTVSVGSFGNLAQLRQGEGAKDAVGSICTGGGWGAMAWFGTRWKLLRIRCLGLGECGRVVEAHSDPSLLLAVVRARDHVCASHEEKVGFSRGIEGNIFIFREWGRCAEQRTGTRFNDWNSSRPSFGRPCFGRPSF
jgi:hypothetical protein